MPALRASPGFRAPQHVGSERPRPQPPLKLAARRGSPLLKKAPRAEDAPPAGTSAQTTAPQTSAPQTSADLDALLRSYMDEQDG